MARIKVNPEDRKRFTPAERSAQILAGAFDWAQRRGLGTLSLAEAGRQAGVTDGLVAKYFGRISGLREAVLAQAVLVGHADIVADAIEMGMPTHHVPPPLLEQATAIIQAHA